MLSKNHFNLKSLPYAGFWEWRIPEGIETISKGLCSAFGHGYPYTREEGSFWKAILSASELQPFLDLRKEVSESGELNSTIIHQSGYSTDGEIILFRNKMEVVEWSEKGAALRMLGHVVEVDSENDSIKLGLRNNSFFTKLTDQLPGAVYQYQYLSNGLSRFPYASKGIWNIYELTPSQITADATRVFERIHPDDLDTVIASILASYAQLTPWELDYRVVLPAKGERWIRGTAKPEKRDDDSVVWYGYLTDITERKKTEQHLLQTNTELNSILNAGSQVAIISTGVDGVISHFSKGAENLLGYKAREVVGKLTPATFHLENEMDLRSKQLSARLGKEIVGFDVFTELSKPGKHDTREWTYKRKDGSTFPVQLTVTSIADENGVVAGFLCIATDISLIQKAKMALAESEERWQFALEGAGEGVWDWDLASGSIYISPKSKTMLGYGGHEIRSAPENWTKLIHKEDFQLYQTNMDRHLKGETEIYHTEYRIKCSNGDYKWILDRGKVTQRSKNGDPLRIIGTHSDISEIKEKEKELKNTIDIIGEQNRRLLNFAHIVSHNLRSHSGNFEMMFKMLDEVETEDEKQEILGHIRTISEKLSETIYHLNEVVMVQTSIDKQRQDVNLYQFIEKTKNVLAANLSAKKAIVVNNVPKSVAVNYNVAYLESILLNLLSNAVKYSHPDRRPEVEFRIDTEKKYTILDVADNGLGINLDLHRDKLFGMYKTFHPHEDAKGIGLFITRNQVEAMGGKIEVESEVGKGCTFRVFFA